MLGAFIFIILLGFPIAFTLMAMGVMFGYYAYYVPGQEFFDNRVFYLLSQNTFSIMNNDVLTAVPLFLFMGYMIERSNILDRLFHSLQVALRAIPGAMAVAALVTCALFATATGIVGAVVTLMGLLAFPAMLKAGYDQKLSAGVICAGGTLGILIPPSIMLIVYGATSAVSVVRLYAAAMIPGFLLAGLYVVYVIARAALNPKLAPKLPKEQTDIPWIKVVLLLAQAFVPLAVLILSVLGAILFGLATPSEAAAIGALGAMVLAIGLPRVHLGPAQGGGVPDRAHLGDGVLAVRRLVDLLLGLLLPRRRGADQGFRAGDAPEHRSPSCCCRRSSSSCSAGRWSGARSSSSSCRSSCRCCRTSTSTRCSSASWWR